MSDLVLWLRAQLDEDQRIAEAAEPGPWRVDGYKVYASHPVDKVVSSSESANHIAGHDPNRVLREIDAKRALLAEYITTIEHMGKIAETLSRLRGKDQNPLVSEMEWSSAIHKRDALHGVLRLLALPYTDRPGYREEWRP